MTQEEAEIEDAKIGQAIDAVLQTDAGRILFTHIFNVSGYSGSAVAISGVSYEVLTSNMLYNEARRTFYSQLRRLATPALIGAVEQAAEETNRVKMESVRQQRSKLTRKSPEEKH